MMVGSSRWFRMKNKFRRNCVLILNCIVIASLVFALCGIRIQKNSNIESTIFLLDISDSMESSKTEVIEFVNASLKNCPKNGKVGIIAFGQDTKVEQFVSNKISFKDFQTTPISTATNLEKAVQAAISMFDTETGKRIVLVSDGKENEGNLSNMVYSLGGNHIDVKVKKIESKIGKEVYVDRVQVSDTVKLGDQFHVEVSVQSNVKTTARLSLYQGSKLKKQQMVEIQTGSNNFVFQDTQTEKGLKTYRAIVEPAEDSQTLNNEYSAFTQAEQNDKILFIEGKANQGDVFAELLDSINVSYDKVTPAAAPTSLKDMMEYKAIIMLDVYAEDLAIGFLKHLEAYVKDYGGGFITIGGKNSYALGGYRNTPIEKVLPVRMDLSGEKKIPSMTTVYVIDHSGSMSMSDGEENRLQLAKDAAEAALHNMREIDEVGVLEFDDTYSWVSKINKLTDIEAIEDDIDSISNGGGTSIYPAVNEAYKKIRKSNGELKHIVLLSDGEDEFGFSEYSDILDKMKAENITLSTVTVGTDANATLMKNLAEKGQGRNYVSESGEDLPRIFAQEVFLSTRSYLNNGEFTPILRQKGSLLSGVVEDGIPNLLGYVATSAKELATVYLESDKKEPILASWQYGLGKTIAFTSDGENKWTGKFATWDKYGAMWKNMVQYVIMDEEEQGGKVEIEQNGSIAHIKYVTEQYSKNSKVTAIYTDEEGKQQTIRLDATGSGKYEADVTFPGVGLYMINLSQKEGEQVVANKNTAVAMQYSKEYRYMEESEALEEFVKNVAGVFVEKPSEVFETKLDTVKASYDTTNVWLLLACLVFFFTIAYKRLQFSFVERKWNQWKERKNTAKENDLGTIARETDSSMERTEQKNPEKQKKTEKQKKQRPTKLKKEDKTKQKQQEMEATAAMLLKKKNERK